MIGFVDVVVGNMNLQRSAAEGDVERFKLVREILTEVRD